MVYGYATTAAHDPRSDRVSLLRQKPGEYRDFTGLPLVCKTIHKEYTTTLSRNTKVTVSAEDVSAYVAAFYPNQGGTLDEGDLRVAYTAYGELTMMAGSFFNERVFKSPKLNLMQLLELQRRLPRMQVSFLCYMLSKVNSKPMYWNLLTADFNRLFSAKVAEGPLLLGAPPLPFVLPEMGTKFTRRTGCELSLASRWPKPGSEGSPRPAVVLNVEFDASKNLDLPFAEKPLDKVGLEMITKTFWSVDEICQTTDIYSPSHKQEICDLIHETALCCTLSSEWFLNFRCKCIEPLAIDPRLSASPRDCWTPFHPKNHLVYRWRHKTIHTY